MACKQCHPVKKVKQFEQGKIYFERNSKYICALVGNNLYNLICLDNGNRWSESADLRTLSKKEGFKFSELICHI